MLRLEIAWWKGVQKVDQTHKPTWNARYLVELKKVSPIIFFFFISGPIFLQIVLLGPSWPKKSKSVLRFEITWWEGGQKVDQTHKPTWNAR